MEIFSTSTTQGPGKCSSPIKTSLRLNGPWHSLVDMIKAQRHLHDGPAHRAPPGRLEAPRGHSERGMDEGSRRESPVVIARRGEVDWNNAE